VGMFLESVLELRVQSVLGNQNLYQVVGEPQSIGPILNLGAGNSMELVENEEGEGGFEGNKGRFCCGGVFDSSLAVVNCTEEQNMGSEMLDIYPLATVGEQGGSYSMSLDWVVVRVIFFCHVVGLSCEGFENQLMALFAAIEASRPQSDVGSLPDLSGKSGNRGNRELKRLVCSVNYDGKGGQSHRVTWKGRGGKCSL